MLLVARDGDRGAAGDAVVGHGDEDPAAGLEDAPRLGEEARRVGDVLEHLAAPDEVDLAVAERERAVGLDEAQVRAGHVAPGPLQRALGDLDADRVGADLAQRGDEAAGAAAEVEHPLAGLRLAEQQRPPRGPQPRLRVVGRVGPDALVEVAHAQEATNVNPAGWGGRANGAAMRTTSHAWPARPDVRRSPEIARITSHEGRGSSACDETRTSRPTRSPTQPGLTFTTGSGAEARQRIAGGGAREVGARHAVG